MLLVTGPMSRNMEIALNTYEATPDPKLVVAVGDCGCCGGIFGKVRQPRARIERDSSGCGRSGLPADTGGADAGDIDRDSG